MRTIIEMVQLTRLDCAVASAGLIRMGLALARHHARHRSVVPEEADRPARHAHGSGRPRPGERSHDGPEPPAARSFDLQQADAQEAGYARLVTPAAKFGICKAAPRLIYEAMECLGGNGYVEESALPRLYREAPVNAIWEGSGNVIALDILRAETREPEVATSVLERLMEDVRDLPGASDAARDIVLALHSPDAEARARFIAERLFVLAATAALVRSAPPADCRGLRPDPPGRPVPDDRRQRSRGGRESLAGARLRGHIGNLGTGPI